MDEYNREEAYRIYVTRSLQLVPQNSYITKTYIDMLKPQKVDDRSGDEIAADIIVKAGLKLKEV